MDDIPVSTPAAPEQKTMLDFEYAKEKIDSLLKSWDEELTETERRRVVRNIEVDVADLQRQQKLLTDETLIPIRIVDINIRREAPPYIAYISQSKRLGIFKLPYGNTIPSDQIESEFTRVLRYREWITPFIKAQDGAATHGWDSVEVIYDEDYPGHVFIDHIGHENLIFPRDAKSLESCAFILRAHDCSRVNLDELRTTEGFDAAEIDKIVEDKLNQDASVYRLYKVYIKLDGIVLIAWYSIDADKWIAAPRPFTRGIRRLEVPQPDPNVAPGMTPPMPEMIAETTYPCYLLFYNETEDSTIIGHKGRVFLDEYKQAGATALWSAIINGTQRASGVYASPKNNLDISGGMPKQYDFTLKHGSITDVPLDLFHPDYPDPIALSIVQQLETQNSVETGQIAWAVNNRKDSRKTAREVESAERQTALINSVQLTLFSAWFGNVMESAWRIVQSCAYHGLIEFCPMPATTPGMKAPNNQQYIGLAWMVLAAGDLDVVERADKIQRMLQVAPMFAQVPGANIVFFKQLIKLMFPDDYEMYHQAIDAAMMQGQQQNQVVQLLVNTLNTLTRDDDGNILPAFKEYEMQLNQVIKIASQQTMPIAAP